MRNLKKSLVCMFITLLISYLWIVPVQAQSRPDQPFVLPQTVFVGDLARLVVPLAFSTEEPFIVDTPERLPQTPELMIKRIELERRGGVSRLLIDFIPFETGTILFPEIEFFSLDETFLNVPAITGLEVQVASILTTAQAALSAPASPLAIPGTSFLIYGTITMILILLFLGIGGSIWGRRHFWEFWEGIRRRIFLFKMKKFIRQLRREISLQRDNSPVHYLSMLSGEFREFLSLFTGINCRSLTSGEFLELPFAYPGPGPVYLSGLFQTWDTLRFSGRGMEMADLTHAMGEIEDFLAALMEAGKGVKK